MPAQDFISALPDHMLLMILSLLDLKQIMRTSVLSKRWEHLGTMLSTLVFEEGKKKTINWSFINWVSSVLLRRYEVDIPLEKLEIDCHYNQLYAVNIDEWARVARRKHVEDLTLHLRGNKKYYLPHYICYNTYLVRLCLYGCKVLPHEIFEWPLLQKLSLSMEVKTDIVSKILSASPMLKCMKLVACRGQEPLHINSTSLLELVIKEIGLYTSSPSQLSAPNLEFLHLHGSSHGAFQLINVSSLRRVVLEYTFFLDCADTICEYHAHLMNGLRHVEHLELGQLFVQALSILEARGLRPAMSSRTWLKMNVQANHLDTPGIVYVLRGSPFLENVEVCHTTTKSWRNNYRPLMDRELESYWSSREDMIVSLPLMRLKTARLIGFDNRNSITKSKRKMLLSLLTNYNDGAPVALT